MDNQDWMDSRNLKLYLDQIAKFPTFNDEEEKKIGERIRKGDMDAMRQLIEANLKFVVSYAKKYRGMGLSLLDLINEGNVGLIEAAKRFDPNRNVRFISYAVWWIRQAMLQSLAEHSRIVRLPLNRAGTLYRIGKVSRQLDQELGRQPSAEEIAKKLNLSIEEVQDTMNIANTHISLDDPYSNDQDDNALVDYLMDENAEMPDERTYSNALGEDMEKALGTLSDREREILTLYFGLSNEDPLTLEEIGRKMSLTRERIRQIKEKAIMRLRHSSRAKYLRGYI